MSDFTGIGTFGGLPVVESDFVPEGVVYLIGDAIVTPPGFVSGTLPAMPAPVPFTQKVIDTLRREAVVLLPLVYSVIAAVPSHTSLIDWKVWGPVVIGIVLRQVFTSPTHEVEQKVDEAHAEGFDTGKNFGKSVLLHQLEALKPPADQ
jgi:hypothetical protein